MTDLADMVVIGQEDWDAVWRRNQFVMAGLARRYPATRFLFVELPCDLSYGLRSGTLFRRGSVVQRKLAALRAGVRRLADPANVWLLTPPKLLPDAHPAGERANARLQAWTIRRALARLGVRQPLLWTQNPFAAPLLGRLGEAGVVYDVTDDWAALSGASPRFVARVTAGDRALAAAATCVIACSEHLYAQQRTRRADTVLIPNGVDVAHYAAIGTPGVPVAPAVAALPRPVLGYTGTLHDARLDVDLVCALAAARPDIQQVFVGPDLLTGAARARLAAFPQVHRLGPVPYADLPAYMQGFDVLMIPHQVSRFTESLNPIKLFEYLAAGLPVVATAVAGVRDYADLFTVAASPAEFIAGVDRLVAADAPYDQTRARALAHAAGWDRRIDAVIAALERTVLSAGEQPAPWSDRGSGLISLPRESTG